MIIKKLCISCWTAYILVSPSLQSSFQNGFKNLVFVYVTMNALICTVSCQLVAAVLSVCGGVHQTSHFLSVPKDCDCISHCELLGFRTWHIVLCTYLNTSSWEMDHLGLSGENLVIFGGSVGI